MNIIQINAQKSKMIEPLYYSFDFCGAKLNECIGSLDIEQKIGIIIKEHYAPFIAISVSECIYNQSSTKNYDFQAKLGLGMAYRHFFKSADGLEVSMTGLATVGNYDFNYWQGRLICAYAIRNRLGISVLGVGLQYSSPYDNEFKGKTFQPCAMLGWSF